MKKEESNIEQGEWYPDHARCSALLSEFADACRPRGAYDKAEPIVELLAETRYPSTLWRVARYLRDEGSPWRDVLLSCFADNDLPLRDSLAMEIKFLTSSADRSLAQSAALALKAGGERS